MIEDTLLPETVNEMRLLQRITELKLTIYSAGGMETRFAYEQPTSVEHISPTLVLAAELRTGWENDTKFAVNVRAATKPKELHFGYYMPREALTQWTVEAAAQQMGKMHLTCIRALADAINAEYQAAETLRKGKPS